jgi:hypothetical protein
MVKIWNPPLDIRAGHSRPRLQQVAHEPAKPLAASPRVRYQEAVFRKFRDGSSGYVPAKQVVQNIANPD